ncbi:hypothetical protein ACFL3G_03310 [Planctomycetota bacterium]
MFRDTMLTILILVFFGVGGCKKHEHPAEHPEESAEAAALTKDQLADAVEAYVAKVAKSHGGYFVAMDEKTGKGLKLKLDKVHRKRLSKVGKDLYFACADFVTDEGKVYDLDVFMKGSDKDDLIFSEFSIHKEAGKERYTWYEQGGVWKKKSIDQPTEEHPKEHPNEHPKEGAKEHPKGSEHPSEHPE